MRPDRLDSWKEIAAHLGRTVRTVQRWERDLALPVHRVPGRKRDMVYAVAHELDAWLATGRGTHALAEPRGPESGEVAVVPAMAMMGASAPSAPTEKDFAQPDNGIDGSPSAARHSLSESDISRDERVPSSRSAEGRAQRWAWAGGGLAVGVALMYAVLLATGVVEIPAWAWSANPADWDMDERHLIVLDAKGREIWRHKFPFPLDPVRHKWIRKHNQTATVGVFDLDGDGRNEVLFVPGHHDGNRLFCFEADGGLRFVHSADDLSRRYGSVEFAGPYVVRNFLVTRNPDGKSNIWVGSIHNLEFPAVLEKLDSTGRRVADGFWHAGHDSSITEGTLSGRRAIFVGYLENDGQRASLAVIDYENPTGFTPAQNDHYQCKNCAAGDPLALFIFPRTEIAQATKALHRVNEIRIAGDGTVTAAVGTTATVGNDSRYEGISIYKFDRTLRLTEAFTASSNSQVHESLRVIGLIDHPYHPSEDRDLFPVLRWNGSTFEKIMGPGHSADAPAPTRATNKQPPPPGIPAQSTPALSIPATARPTQ